jgi:hypothetical protein
MIIPLRYYIIRKSYSNMKYLYRSRFESPIISCVKGEEPFVSEASLKNLRTLLPQDIDFSKNIDLLGVAFNAAVVNQFNKNDDGIDSALAVEIIQNFIHKPTNIEHQKEKIVGHIISAGFSEYYDSNKIISAEQAGSMTAPFNIALGAVVYKHSNKEFAELMERSVNASDTLYNSMSASWEIGFSQYAIAVGSRDLQEAEIIKDAKQIEEMKPMLKAYGGAGSLRDGTKVYRLLKGELFPLGIGFTTKPAADVQGIYSENNQSNKITFNDKRDKKTYFDIKNNKNFKKNESSISQCANDDVKIKKEINMDIEKILAELKDLLVEKKFSEEAVASMTTTFADAIKKKDEEYRASLAKAEEERIAALVAKEELVASVKQIQDQLNAASAQIAEFENFKKQEEAVARFNSRMESIDSEYELDDEDRKVLADDLKALPETEESFASYKEKVSVMWKHKNKQAKAEFEKQVQARIDEEVSKKLAVSTASVEGKTPEEIAEEALEKAKASSGGLPNNNEESSQQETLREKFAKAFSRENIVIS